MCQIREALHPACRTEALGLRMPAAQAPKSAARLALGFWGGAGGCPRAQRIGGEALVQALEGKEELLRQ